MKSTIYQVSAIIGIVLIVVVFTTVNQKSSNVVTGNAMYDMMSYNAAFYEQRCTSFTDQGTLYGGIFYQNYCGFDETVGRDRLFTHECVAGKMQMKKIDCAATGKRCVDNQCIIMPKTRKYTQKG